MTKYVEETKEEALPSDQANYLIERYYTHQIEYWTTRALSAEERLQKIEDGFTSLLGKSV